MRQSMGRTGVCWDNAQAETFFASLKVECVYRTALANPERARRIVGRWIETWYNQRRRHSSLDYQTPNERYYELTTARAAEAHRSKISAQPKVRGYLRSRQRQPWRVARYFQEHHVRYAAA